MEHMPWPIYMAITVLLTVAMAAHGAARVPQALTQDVAWALTMLGWAAVVIRFWWGVFGGDMTISWSGGIGLLLLASGQVLSVLRSRR